MKYLHWDDKYWCVDIETDGLRPTVVWVFVASNMATGEVVTLTDMDEMREWVEQKRLNGGIFIGHNFLHFDGPVLNKLCGTKLSAASIIDTMLLSTVYSPSIQGGHSLGAWGARLDFGKIEHEDWSILSPEMILRCQGDVELTKRTYGYLCRKLNSIGFSEVGIGIEHLAWVIIRKQQMNGFHFDYARAEVFRNQLLAEADKLLAKLAEFFPAQLECVRVYKTARNKDGSYGKGYLDNKERYAKLRTLADNSYEAYDYVAFNPASPDERRDKLIEMGWKPLEFTKPTPAHPEGQAQPTRKGKLSPSLQAFVDGLDADNGVVLLVDWMTANGRAGIIKTWMNAYNPNDECIHGQLWIANTLRYKHSAPNTANAPGVIEDKQKHPIMGRAGGWAYECRDLWDTRDRNTRRMVGVDAKGIQLRVLAHYLNDPDFTSAILSEDPHAANQKKMGLLSRALTKTITYAVLMGAGDDRIALEARVSLAEAKSNKAKFFEQVPGLPKLIAKLKSEQKKTGRITLCDGSKIIVEQQHTVIPYLLQGDESRIMKKAKIIADRLIRKAKLDVLWCGDIHDEWQCDVLLEHVDAFVAICTRAFKEAGEFFNYNLPIDCEAKVGFTWAETH